MCLLSTASPRHAHLRTACSSNNSYDIPFFIWNWLFISLNIAWDNFSLRLCDCFCFCTNPFLKIAWQICHANMFFSTWTLTTLTSHDNGVMVALSHNRVAAHQTCESKTTKRGSLTIFNEFFQIWWALGKWTKHWGIGYLKENKIKLWVGTVSLNDHVKALRERNSTRTLNIAKRFFNILNELISWN